MHCQPVFLDCPAYLDRDGTLRCGLPAEVEDRYIVSSTDGPLESGKIRCPRGHRFNGPIELLTLPADGPHTVPPPARDARRHRGSHIRLTGGPRDDSAVTPDIPAP
jgi:hypothetical protein